jgi:REP-associated tyrosine transposase
MKESQRIRHRDLPHWDMPDAAYFITTCLEGSISAQGLLEIDRYRDKLQHQSRPPNKTAADLAVEQWKRTFSLTDSWLDLKPTVSHLHDPQLAQIIVDAFYHFAGQRYDLLGFVVMPSHIHWVFQPLQLWIDSLEEKAWVRTARERIVHSVNRHTAFECNKVLQTKGEFWQHESYDHWVRDADELERILLYIEGNPVKAGLAGSPEHWKFSSARDRSKTGSELGMPLVR